MRTLGKLILFSIIGLAALLLAFFVSEHLSPDEYMASKLGVSIADCRAGLLSVQIQAGAPGVFSAHERESFCSIRVPKNLSKDEAFDYWIKNRGF